MYIYFHKLEPDVFALLIKLCLTFMYIHNVMKDVYRFLPTNRILVVIVLIHVTCHMLGRRCVPRAICEQHVHIINQYRLPCIFHNAIKHNILQN